MKFIILLVFLIASKSLLGATFSGKPTLFINRCESPYDIGFSYMNEFDQLTSYGKLIHLHGGRIGNQFTVNLEARTLVTFHKNFSMYPILISPGDTLEITCIPEGGYEFMLNGNKDTQVNFLTELEKRFGFSFSRMSGLDLSNKTNFSYLMEREQELYKTKKLHVSEALKANKISKSYHDEIMNELLYKHVLELLTPYTIPSRTFSLKNIPQSYINNLRAFQSLTNIDSLMASASYRKFLWAYYQFLSYNSELNEEKSLVDQYMGIQHHFTRKAANYLQLKVLISSKEDGRMDLDEFSKKFLMTCTDSTYLMHYNRFLDSFNPSINKNETVLNLAGETLTWEQVLHSNKSKLIFIDFWASWCGPCIKEMPDSKKLQESLKGRDISFMYVSIDDNKNKWIASARKLPIDYQTTTHLLTDRNSELSKAFNIPPIPRYVIINKSGVILASDTPRPSDPSLITIINNLLKK